MPFLVDSVMAEITARHLAVRLVVHPIFAVTRDASGHIAPPRAGRSGEGGHARKLHACPCRPDRRARARDDRSRPEAWCSATSRSRCRTGGRCWRASARSLAELKIAPPPLPDDEVPQAVQFLEWLIGNNFTFLGVREYRIDAQTGEPVIVPDSGLGLLRKPEAQELKGRAGPGHRPARIAGLVRRADGAADHQGQPALAHPSPGVHGPGARSSASMRTGA